MSKFTARREEEKPFKMEVEYEPRTWAEYLHDTIKQFIVMVIHRRGGKTTASLYRLNFDCLGNKNHRYAYIAPLRNQAKRIAWKMIKEITEGIPGMKYNETELTVFYPNGSELMLLGGDNPDAIRGLGLNGVVLDEYPQMSPIIFTEIVTKCVADTGGYVIIIGTPKGKGHFFRIHIVAKRSKDWLSIFKTIDDSLRDETGETIDNLKNALKNDKQLVKDGLMTQEEFDQEWYLSWEAALKGAVYGKQLTEARNKKRITTVPYNEALPVFTVWDLGISKGNQMAIGFFQRPSGREIHMIDYYENTGFGLPHYAAHIKKKPYVYGKHFLPFDADNREKSSGKTFTDAAEKLLGGPSMVEVINRLSVEEGIDLTRSMWRRLWIDAKNCAIFEDVIGSYVYEWDEKHGRFRSKPVHNFASNGADMLRYAATIEDEMINEKEKKEEKTIQAPVQDDDEYIGELDPDTDGKAAGPSDKELSKM